MHSFDSIFARLLTPTGLLVIGAGASAGISPLGRDFWRGPPLDYLPKQRSLPSVVNPRSALTKRIIEHSKIMIGDIFPEREFRPGSHDYPIDELLKSMPDAFARESLKNKLAKALFFSREKGFVTDSYRVFQKFYPSIIADYNHDGLAREFCGSKHFIVEMHGSVHPVYGSPEYSAWVSSLRELNIEPLPDNLIMGLPESWTDSSLHRRLDYIMNKTYRHVAIIGYGFAKINEFYDDAVKLVYFIRRFRHYTGSIFVINHDPSSLCEMLSEELKIKNIYPIKCYWNLLSHAYFETLRNPDKFKSLDQAYDFLLYGYGSGQVFPISCFLPH